MKIPPSCLLTPLPQWVGGEKTKTVRSLTSCHHELNKLSLREINFIYCQLKRYLLLWPSCSPCCFYLFWFPFSLSVQCFLPVPKHAFTESPPAVDLLEVVGPASTGHHRHMVQHSPLPPTLRLTHHIIPEHRLYYVVWDPIFGADTLWFYGGKKTESCVEFPFRCFFGVFLFVCFFTAQCKFVQLLCGRKENLFWRYILFCA